jgi:hypothetical protein
MGSRKVVGLPLSMPPALMFFPWIQEGRSLQQALQVRLSLTCEIRPLDNVIGQGSGPE